MTTERAIHANRHNAHASTGPRTAAGKARSGRNARKHGLSAVDPDPQADMEMERLAALIAGEHRSDTIVLGSALAVAEAQRQFQRVQKFKTALLSDSPLAPGRNADANSPMPLEILEEFLTRLERLERYERRALSRRKFAIRRFNDSVNQALQVTSECAAR